MSRPRLEAGDPPPRWGHIDEDLSPGLSDGEGPTVRPKNLGGQGPRVQNIPRATREHCERDPDQETIYFRQ